MVLSTVWGSLNQGYFLPDGLVISWTHLVNLYGLITRMITWEHKALFIKHYDLNIVYCLRIFKIWKQKKCLWSFKLKMEYLCLLCFLNHFGLILCFPLKTIEYADKNWWVNAKYIYQNLSGTHVYSINIYDMVWFGHGTFYH